MHWAVIELLGTETQLQKWADYGQIAAGVMSLLVVPTIIFLAVEVRQQAQNSRTALTTEMTNLMNSVGRVFIDHPGMWKYFHEDAKPEGTDYEQARSIAVTIANAMDQVAAHLDLMSEAAQTAWRQYVQDTYAKSPVLQDYLRDHASWYGPKLRKELGID